MADRFKAGDRVCKGEHTATVTSTRRAPSQVTILTVVRDDGRSDLWESSMVTAEGIRIPKDPEARARLAQFAGLSDDERAAIDEWCHLQAVENEARTRRGLEAHGDDAMGAPCWCGNSEATCAVRECIARRSVR